MGVWFSTVGGEKSRRRLFPPLLSRWIYIFFLYLTLSSISASVGFCIFEEFLDFFLVLYCRGVSGGKPGIRKISDKVTRL